ncbi:MAG TPA: hypothetical protein PLH45_08145 [Synergistales bacterium]|nr:hypothetical protein [Synergistales bacterium]
MAIIGIDPGFSGAIAVIGHVPGVITVFDMPIIVVGKPRKKKKVIVEDGQTPVKKKRRSLQKRLLDLESLRSILSPYATEGGDHHVFIERSFVMPKQGISAAGSYMMSYGFIVGILVGMRIPYTEVVAKTWKRVMMEGMGAEKSMSRVRARQLFPGMTFPKVSDEGKAEALLIAEYGRRSLGLRNGVA